jgi:hypothetical protein
MVQRMGMQMVGEGWMWGKGLVESGDAVPKGMFKLAAGERFIVGWQTSAASLKCTDLVLALTLLKRVPGNCTSIDLAWIVPKQTANTLC